MDALGHSALPACCMCHGPVVQDAQAQAEARVRAAEASIAREIDARMAAAVANRAMWPAAIQSSFAEQQAALGSATDKLRDALGTVQALQGEVRELGHERVRWPAGRLHGNPLHGMQARCALRCVWAQVALHAVMWVVGGGHCTQHLPVCACCGMRLGGS